MTWKSETKNQYFRSKAKKAAQVQIGTSSKNQDHESDSEFDPKTKVLEENTQGSESMEIRGLVEMTNPMSRTITSEGQTFKNKPKDGIVASPNEIKQHTEE